MKSRSHGHAPAQNLTACTATALDAVQERMQAVVEARRRAERLALIARAKDILLRTVLLELAMGQQPDIFDQALPQSFSNQAIVGLRRHRYPFAPLLRLVDVSDVAVTSTDSFFLTIQGSSREMLRRHFDQLKAQAEDALRLLATASNSETPTPSEQPSGSSEILALTVAR